jgi:hypothetical protein
MCTNKHDTIRTSQLFYEIHHWALLRPPTHTQVTQGHTHSTHTYLTASVAILALSGSCLTSPLISFHPSMVRHLLILHISSQIDVAECSTALPASHSALTAARLGRWRQWLRAFDLAGVLLYQVSIKIRCIFFLPLRSPSIWFSLGKMVNQRPHVLLTYNVPVHTNTAVRNYRQHIIGMV